jgi:hypothetical protein
LKLGLAHDIGFLDPWTLGVMDARTLGHLDTCTLALLIDQECKCPSVQVSTWTLVHLDTCPIDRSRVQVSKCPSVQVPKCPVRVGYKGPMCPSVHCPSVQVSKCPLPNIPSVQWSKGPRVHCHYDPRVQGSNVCKVENGIKLKDIKILGCRIRRLSCCLHLGSS